jgi:hypothetical protein
MPKLVMPPFDVNGAHGDDSCDTGIVGSRSDRSITRDQESETPLILFVRAHPKKE